MPKLKFVPSAKSIIIDAEISANLPTVGKFILDTGSSFVTLPWNMVNAIGIPIDPNKTVQTTSVSADGLLGLSFLKHFKLVIDFKKGLLQLT